MAKRVKLGIIGTGLAAKLLHLPALKRLTEEFEIAAVCNHTEEKAKVFAELVGGVPYYLDYKDLLKDKNIEAVDIALPINLNYKVTVDCAKAGKHIFLEKPLGADLTEAKKQVALCLSYNKVMMLGENYRYRQIYERIKELIKNNSIGKPYAAQWNAFTKVRTDYEYGATKWRQKHSYAGGFITDGGVHNIAALRLLFGEVESVSALSTTVNPAIGSPDTISILLKFKSGIIVNLNMFFSSEALQESSFRIFCSSGIMEINDTLLTMKCGSEIEQENYNDDLGFYAEFKDFYEAITTGKKRRDTFKDGYKDLEVILAAVKSAKVNKKINLK